MLFRLTGMNNEVIDRMIMPGDLVAGGESLTAGGNSTAGSGTLTGAQIATGIINRTGPGGAFTDTTDTSTAILLALAGNTQGADAIQGISFRLLYINTVAFAMTFAAGTGVIAGSGTLNVAASTWREYLVTILNSTPQVLLSCATTNANATVTFVLQANQTALPIGTVTPGMTVSGTGITAGTTVLGVTQGQGGITGVTLSANATATNNPVGLTFLPTIRFDGLRSGTL